MVRSGYLELPSNPRSAKRKAHASLADRRRASERRGFSRRGWVDRRRRGRAGQPRPAGRHVTATRASTREAGRVRGRAPSWAGRGGRGCARWRRARDGGEHAAGSSAVEVEDRQEQAGDSEGAGDDAGEARVLDRGVHGREGSRGRQSSRFGAERIRTAHRHTHGDPPGQEQWLLYEWPAEEKEPTKPCRRPVDEKNLPRGPSRM